MEITVVLAVVAIIATMVATFSVFLSGRSKISIKTNDLMQDVVSIKAVMEAWTNDLSKEANIEFPDGENINILSTTDNNYFVSLSNGVLSAKFKTDDKTLTQALVVVDKLVFNVLKNETQKLFICKAFYTLENEEQYISFTINPFVGDAV